MMHFPPLKYHNFTIAGRNNMFSI